MDIYGFLGLDGSPFSPATSSQGYFQTEQSAQILQELCFGITSRKGFLLLLGEVGVGKTSLLLQLLGTLQSVKGLTTAWVFNTAVQRSDLLSAIVADFGLSVSKGASLAEMIDTLHAHFLEVNESGGNCAIVIDEAHNLSIQALEALRMLSNLEAGGQKLVQILLAGQPELDSTLSRPDLRQLRSRIYIHRTLQSLTRREVREYCDYKLSLARKDLELPKRSFRLLWSATQGNLRMIHLVMDRALHGLVAHSSLRITPGILNKALKELAGHHASIRASRVRRWRRIGLGLAGGLACLGLMGGMTDLGRDWKKTIQGDLSIAARSSYGAAPSTKEVPAGTGMGQARGEMTGSRPSQAKPQSEGSAKRFPVQETYRSSPKAAAKAGTAPRMRSAGQKESDLLHFLDPYGMEGLLPKLKEAVRQKRISVLGRALPDGLQLLGTERLPRSEGPHFSSLNWRNQAGQGPKWLVLWRPPLRIDFDRPGGSSRSDLLVLQRMLMELGYYSGRLDGLYGRQTHQAVRDFQREAGLQGSSGLNPETVFKLCFAYDES